MRPKKPRCQMHDSCGVQVRRQPRLSQGGSAGSKGFLHLQTWRRTSCARRGGPGSTARATALSVAEYERISSQVELPNFVHKIPEAPSVYSEVLKRAAIIGNR